MPIYLGTKRLSGLHLGTAELSKVYLGTQLVYDKGGGPSAATLYDSGFIDGISWYGNYLPRQNYTSIASYSFEATRMALTVASEPGYSSVNHNCHVCTSELITVPSDATKMCVQAYATDLSGDANPYLIFGLLPTDCPNSMSTANGGQLTSALNASAQVLTTYTLTLGAGMAGAQYLAVVNMRRNARANYPCTVRIAKVWFE